MATKLGSVVGYRSGIYNGYKVIGTQTLGLRGLVLWLKFNEGSGNIAYDSSFYNNHGTIYGATWTDGKFGKALSFDGVDDYVDCGNDESLYITDTITVEAWVKPAAEWLKNEEQHVVTDHFNNIGWSLEFWNGVPYFYFIYGANWEEGHYTVCGPEVLQTNRWYHMVGTYDKYAKKLRIYINGELVGEKNTDGEAINTTGEVWINNKKFNGIIDEVRIYNRALSENEIKMLYYNRIGAVPSKAI